MSRLGWNLPLPCPAFLLSEVGMRFNQATRFTGGLIKSHISIYGRYSSDGTGVDILFVEMLLFYVSTRRMSI